MIDKDVVRYYVELQQSGRPRAYFCAPSPDDPQEQWFFETVDDDGKIVAIRQVSIAADGTRHAYSPEHMEDEWGFLTDQPIDYADQLSPCTAAQFNDAWGDS